MVVPHGPATKRAAAAPSCQWSRRRKRGNGGDAIGVSPDASGAAAEKWPSNAVAAPDACERRGQETRAERFEEHRLNASYAPARRDVIPVHREIVTVQRFRGAS